MKEQKMCKEQINNCIGDGRLTTHRMQKCPNVWHAAANDSNQNVVKHFYFKKKLLPTCKEGKLVLGKNTTVKNVIDNFTITLIIMAVMVTMEVLLILEMWYNFSLISFLYSAGNWVNVFGI